MAVKVDYIARETASNLRRGLTITIATILTVTVSLSLVGFALMLREAVDNATERWQGGIEFVVFLNADASPEQIEVIGRELEESPDVESITYIDKDAAYEEFVSLFSDSPEMIDTVSPEILPPSYRVVPVNKEADLVEALAGQFTGQPGVREVVLASETIRVIESFASWVTGVVLLVAMILLLSAGLLILNTIRMAMYARRREIEVMKLVGATNWFIRLPFMVEGLVQGLVGGLLSVGAIMVGWPLFQRSLPNPESFRLLEAFEVGSGQTLLIYALVLFVGCMVGVIGAAVAVTRFLDV
jgi:cell division transport system permease protein